MWKKLMWIFQIRDSSSGLGRNCFEIFEYFEKLRNNSHVKGL